MATLYVAELKRLGGDIDGKPVPIALCDEGNVTANNVTFTTTTQSNAFATGTKFIRISSDAEAHLAFGDNPTATTSSPIQIQADTVEYFAVAEGEKVAAVAAA